MGTCRPPLLDSCCSNSSFAIVRGFPTRQQRHQPEIGRHVRGQVIQAHAVGNAVVDEHAQAERGAADVSALLLAQALDAVGVVHLQPCIRS